MAKTKKLTPSEITAITDKISKKLSEKRGKAEKELEVKIKKSPLAKQYARILTGIKLYNFKVESLRKDRDSLQKRIRAEYKNVSFNYGDSPLHVSIANTVKEHEIRNEVVLANMSPDFDVNKLVDDLVNKFSK